MGAIDARRFDYSMRYQLKGGVISLEAFRRFQSGPGTDFFKANDFPFAKSESPRPRRYNFDDE